MVQDSFDELFQEDADRFVILPKYVLLDKRLNGQHRDLYCLLKTYAFQKKTCFPSIARLARQLYCTDRTIRNSLNVLVECGLIQKKRRPNKTSIYTIRRPEEVYVESVNPWKLKDWYVESLKETLPPLDTECFNKEDGEVVSEDKDEEARVEAALAKKREARLRKMTGGIGDMEERAARARSNAARNKTLKNGRQVSFAGDAEIDPVHPSQKPLNSRDVEAVWRDTAVEIFGIGSGIDAPWGGMEYKVVKGFIAQYGADVVIRGIDSVLRNWQEYCDRFRLSGPPNVKLIAYWGKVWFPEIEMGQKFDPSSKREKSLRQGEFEDDGNEETVKFL